MISSAYLSWPLDPEKLRRIVANVIATVKRERLVFDAVAFTGYSGALVAPIVAYQLRKPVLIVRKPKEREGSHSNFPVEGETAITSYVVVDDFISDGNTVRRVIRELRQERPSAECVGVLTYTMSSEPGWVDSKSDLVGATVYPTGGIS